MVLHNQSERTTLLTNHLNEDKSMNKMDNYTNNVAPPKQVELEGYKHADVGDVNFGRLLRLPPSELRTKTPKNQHSHHHPTQFLPPNINMTFLSTFEALTP